MATRHNSPHAVHQAIPNPRVKRNLLASLAEILLTPLDGNARGNYLRNGVQSTPPGWLQLGSAFSVRSSVAIARPRVSRWLYASQPTMR